MDRRRFVMGIDAAAADICHPADAHRDGDQAGGLHGDRCLEGRPHEVHLALLQEPDEPGRSGELPTAPSVACGLTLARDGTLGGSDEQGLVDGTRPKQRPKAHDPLASSHDPSCC